MFYMRKLFGIREIILLVLLLGIGLTLALMGAGYFILILFGVSVLIIGFAFVLFLITSKQGYKVDFEKQGVEAQKLEFRETCLFVGNLNKAGEPVFTETHPYEKLEKIAIRKDVIYIYAQVSVFYYIPADALSTEDREKLVALLHEKVKDTSKFRMKKTYRIFPKKQKVTLEHSEENNKNQ